MLSIVRRMLRLAGNYAPRLKIAFVISILEGIFIKAPMMLVLYLLIKMFAQTVTIKDAWIIGILTILSVILRGISKRLVDHFQSATGYEILARERMKLGDRLKRLPMGYFTEGNIGNITSVITSDLVFIEQHSMKVLSKVITGYINTIMGIVMMIIIDYRVGIISIITIIMAILVFKTIHKVGKYHSTLRQENQSRLTSVILEYVKGITVFKAFNMVGDRANMINDEFRRYRDISIDFEKKLIPVVIRYESCFTLGIALTVLASTYFTFNKTLDISFMLVILIFIFELYLPFKALGPLSAQLRIMEVGLNRYDAINNIDIIDEDGKDIVLDNFDIEFRDVSFSYEHDEVIHNMSFKVPEHSMTALVGKSGCGKTTIANLIARFWDIQKGEVKIGGVNVKKMTCDSLLKNISMVFQNVYLFQDTILNNIKFGKQDATMEEVIEASKKARCHDFIMKLEKGYDTVIGEGGSTLSGGEKQRISIARAILKDAPIILLDEATASVDPDNEKHIQMAINELVKDKTLIVIAHRLSTVKNADQILVIDKGKIIQRGTHNELIEKEGQYFNFWQRRMKARSWEISTCRE